MIRVVIIAALALAARSASAQSAQEEVCKGPINIPTSDEVAAQTAQCLLKIDGKLLINGRCKVSVSPDGRGFYLDAGTYQAGVSLTLDRKGAPTVLTASWNRGSGRALESWHWPSLGRVVSNDEWESRVCWRNRRFEMCMSDYLTCECRPNEYYHCKQPE